MSVFGGLTCPRIASRCPHTLSTSDHNLQTEIFPPLRKYLLNHHISSIVSFMQMRLMSLLPLGLLPDRLSSKNGGFPAGNEARCLPTRK